MLIRARKPTSPGYIYGTAELPNLKTNTFSEEEIVREHRQFVVYYVDCWKQRCKFMNEFPGGVNFVSQVPIEPRTAANAMRIVG